MRLDAETHANRLSPADPTSTGTVSLKPPTVVVVPAPARPAGRQWPGIAARAAVAACVLLGAGARVAGYARNPSLWLDEAMLALNVVSRTPAQLLQPLDLNQGAPAGYLMLAKLAVVGLGGGELALRLPSLAAGLAGLVVFVRLAYRAVPAPAARVAVVLFALSPYLTGYAAEFKQYGLDAAVAVGLTWLGLPVWRGEAGRGRLVGLAGAGAAAVWFSHPAAFVLGGVGLAALAGAAARRDRAALLARAAVVGAWVVSFGACYLVSLRQLGANPYLLDYWAGHFLPLRPAALTWVPRHVLAFFDNPGGFSPAGVGVGGLAAACAAVGALALARVDWRLLVAVAVPPALAMAASGLRLYPFAGRLLLFAVPGAVLLVGYGGWAVADRLGRDVRGAGAVVLGVLFAGSAAGLADRLERPVHAEDAREVIAHAHAGWRPGDRAYVFYAAGPAFAYYRPWYPFPADAVSVGAENRGGDPKVFREELRAFAGRPRVWVIVAHRQRAEEAAIRAYLDTMGRCEEEVRKSDALALRYDLTAPPAPPTPGFRTDDSRPE